MRHVSTIPAALSVQPYFERPNQEEQPKRKTLNAPQDNGAFIKAMKQSFVKNPRAMPMTRIMLALLSGWAGNGKPIETTIGIIGKHLSRSRRHVFRLLQDAKEEGYLSYTKTKDRIGRYTGIRIVLNFAAIRFQTKRRREKTRPKSAKLLDMTQKAETNRKHRYKSSNLSPDACFMKKIEAICKRNGFDPPPISP